RYLDPVIASLSTDQNAAEALEVSQPLSIHSDAGKFARLINADVFTGGRSHHAQIPQIGVSRIVRQFGRRRSSARAAGPAWWRAGNATRRAFDHRSGVNRDARADVVIQNGRNLSLPLVVRVQNSRGRRVIADIFPLEIHGVGVRDNP